MHAPIIIGTIAIVIGFSDSNSSVTVMEGGPAQVVCVDIKPQGLPLDPFDFVPLNLQTGIGVDIVSICTYRVDINTYCIL